MGRLQALGKVCLAPGKLYLMSYRNNAEVKLKKTWTKAAGIGEWGVVISDW